MKPKIRNPKKDLRHDGFIRVRQCSFGRSGFRTSGLGFLSAFGFGASDFLRDFAKA
jgi:hypothetical protein